ncbi:peptidase S26B, signal peptidase [Archaeoglobus veneficus SNP6]|uniref:Peptidase S26B, signal peptidase n=2 Tax=Archaeoglobus veneficus TaxID=58290 RepID=F2KN33_ARCVS|nr:peptidase S26B, signal peptidase [Archaeoglobus veneficus SNP6]
MAILALAFPVVSDIATGKLTSLIVLSGSMHPIMQVGDVVVVKRCNPECLVAGDIIAFKDPSDRENIIITHRAIEVFTEDGKLTGFRTKGDANEEPDEFVVDREDIIGKAVFIVPLVGYLFEAYHSKNFLAYFTLIILPAFMLTVGEMRKIFSYNLQTERKTEKEGIRKKRKYTVIRKRRFFAIYISLTAALLLALYPITAVEGSEVCNHGFLPCLIICDDIPGYTVVQPGETVRVSGIVDAVQYVVPVFWAVRLSELNFSLPLAFTAIFSSILTFSMYPLWIQNLPELRRKRRRIFGRR